MCRYSTCGGKYLAYRGASIKGNVTRETKDMRPLSVAPCSIQNAFWLGLDSKTGVVS